MSVNTRVIEAIKATEIEIEFQESILRECANTLITNAEKVKQLISNIDNDRHYDSGFFNFADADINKAIRANEAIRALRDTLRKLNYILT